MRNIRRVFVTGASGKLGHPLCKALLEDGYHVIGMSRRHSVELAGVEEVRADVADRVVVEELVSRSDAVIHLASGKEDREAVIDVSARGTLNILDAAMRTKMPQCVILASGDAVNGIYYCPQSTQIDEEMPVRAYPGYYALSKVIEETMFRQYFLQAGVPTVVCRMSWIHADDDILSHLTIAGECFGVPEWNKLMDTKRQAKYVDGRDAVVSLLHPNGTPLVRHIVAVEDCVQSLLLALECEGIEGETFNIAMAEPFSYADAAEYAANLLGVEVLELCDPVGHDFRIDITKARRRLGYEPRYDIYRLIDHAVEHRRTGRVRRPRIGAKG